METTELKVSSITYAIKGRDLLKERGYKAYIERAANNEDREGCGYSIHVTGYADKAEEILRAAGLRVGRSRESGYR